MSALHDWFRQERGALSLLSSIALALFVVAVLATATTSAAGAAALGRSARDAVIAAVRGASTGTAAGSDARVDVPGVAQVDAADTGDAPGVPEAPAAPAARGLTNAPDAADTLATAATTATAPADDTGTIDPALAWMQPMATTLLSAATGVPADENAALATTPDAQGRVRTDLGDTVARGVGIDDPVAFLNALLLEGLLGEQQYIDAIGDPTLVAAIREALDSGGQVAVDSPGQRELDRLLAQTGDQMRATLAEPLDLQAGPTGAQLLSLYSLAGGDDFALTEILTNWLFAQHPDLELRFDRSSGKFAFVKDDTEVNSPFLDALRDQFKADDIDRMIGTELRDDDAEDGTKLEDSLGYRAWNPTADERTSRRRRQHSSDYAGDTFSVRPKFEHLNAHKDVDLEMTGNDDWRINHVAGVIGLTESSTTWGGVWKVPGEARVGFDVNDNHVSGSSDPTHGRMIGDLLRAQAPELLTGSDYFLINDNAERFGGLGDDFFVQVGGNTTIDPGGGTNSVVLADGSAATVVDTQGDTTVRTSPFALGLAQARASTSP